MNRDIGAGRNLFGDEGEDCLHILVAAAVPDQRQAQPLAGGDAQRPDLLRGIVGRRHQVEVVPASGLQVE